MVAVKKHLPPNALTFKLFISKNLELSVMKLENKKPNSKKEVVFNEAEFRRLVKYIKQLEAANKKLNRQIEEYNRLFAEKSTV